MQDQEPSAESGASNMDRLERLAAAYASAPTLDAVADAIISRTPIAGSVNERNPVMEVISLVVRDEGTLEALMTGGALSDELHAEMLRAVDQDGPAMPAATLLELVLGNIRIVAGRPPAGA